MPFLLSKGGNNVIAEVQRWQYFLLTQDIAQVGKIDGDFGNATVTATKFFQVKVGTTATGELDSRTLGKAEELGYRVLEDNYYKERAGKGFPSEPDALSSPTNPWRNDFFGCFMFKQKPRASRPDAEAITIEGSCDGTAPDWAAANVVRIQIPQLRFAVGYTGTFTCHAKAADLFKALFIKWEEESLLHLIRSYEGCFVPRYIRGKAPAGNGGHPPKKSSSVTKLSNHSFGSAFDINFPDNQLGAVPALCGSRGSVRELVASANALGIYWGGHFTRLDGMHFEITESGT